MPVDHTTYDFSAFFAALGLPFLDLDVPNPRQLVEERIKFLERFTVEGLPTSLSDQYKEAIRLTREVSETCEDYAGMVHDIKYLLDTDIIKLFIRAKSRLDARDEKLTPISADRLASIRSNRDDLLAIIIEALGAGQYNQINELIESHYSTRSKQIFAIMMQKMVLENEVKILEVGAGAVAAPCILGLIARSLLYSLVIVKQGGSLQRNASKEKIIALLPEITIKLLSALTGVEFIFQALEAFLRLSELATEDEHDDFVIKLQKQQKYIDEYIKALHQWMALFIPISDQTIKQIELVS
jgi:hypothetical protein